jgi:hypothetical protein
VAELIERHRGMEGGNRRIVIVYFDDEMYNALEGLVKRGCTEAWARQCATR